jgi:hypothetical protein
MLLQDLQKDSTDMINDDYSYNTYMISIIKLSLLISIILGFIIFFMGTAKAEDTLEKLQLLQKTSEIDYIKIGWPSSLIYDITAGCYQATLQWILISNPALDGRIPPPPAQRAIVVHCFCLLDRFRNQYNLLEYFKLVTQPKVFGQVRIQTAIMCIKHDGTLRGMVTLNETTDNETIIDNSTVIPENQEDNEPIIDNSTVIPEKQEDSEESLPDQPREESSNESESIFQG